MTSTSLHFPPHILHCHDLMTSHVLTQVLYNPSSIHSMFTQREKQNSFIMSFDPSNTTPDTSSPPQHRLHNPEEPLSSLERGRDTDCSPHISYASSEGRFLSGQPSATEANGHPASDGPASEQRGRGVVPGIGSTPPAQDTDPGAAIPGRTAFNTERPLGVAPVPEGQYRSCQAVCKTALKVRCCIMQVESLLEDSLSSRSVMRVLVIRSSAKLKRCAFPCVVYSLG